MALLVETHIPTPGPDEVQAGEREHPIVWIEKVEDFLAELHGEELEVFDDKANPMVQQRDGCHAASTG